MFARILKSGTFHDVVGYVTRQFHDPKEYTPDTWRIIGSDNIFTFDYAKMVQSFEGDTRIYARQGESGGAYLHKF